MDVSKVKLKTNRLILRPILEADLYEIYEIASNNKIAKMAGFKAYSSLDIAIKYVNKFISEKNVLSIVHNSEVIGLMNFLDSHWMVGNFFRDQIDPKHGVVLGYFLKENMWNKGFISEALEEVFSYLKSSTEIEYVISSHFLDNQRSMSVLVKFNFIPKLSVEVKDGYEEFREVLIYSKKL